MPYWRTWLQRIPRLFAAAAAGSPGCTLRRRDLAAGSRLEDIPGRTACLGSGSSHLAVGNPVAGSPAQDSGRSAVAVDMARSCSSRLRRRRRRAQVVERGRCPGGCRTLEVAGRYTSGSTLLPVCGCSVCSGGIGDEGQREMLRTVN